MQDCFSNSFLYFDVQKVDVTLVRNGLWVCRPVNPENFGNDSIC